MKHLTTLVLFSLAALLGACSNTPPINPDGNNIEVSRAKADDDCKKIGNVQGRVTHHSQGFDDALRNLKEDAAGQGANYVQLQKSGAMGQSVSGVAYICE